MNKLLDVLLTALILFGLFLIPYGIICLVIKFFTWCFGLIFSFKFCIGIYAIALIIAIIELYKKDKDA